MRSTIPWEIRQLASLLKSETFSRFGTMSGLRHVVL